MLIRVPPGSLQCAELAFDAPCRYRSNLTFTFNPLSNKGRIVTSSALLDKPAVAPTSFTAYPSSTFKKALIHAG
jgi:hypothetical protein